jgi:hypothetical protein
MDEDVLVGDVREAAELPCQIASPPFSAEKVPPENLAAT